MGKSKAAFKRVDYNEAALDEAVRASKQAVPSKQTAPKAAQKAGTEARAVVIKDNVPAKQTGTTAKAIAAKQTAAEAAAKKAGKGALVVYEGEQAKDASSKKRPLEDASSGQRKKKKKKNQVAEPEEPSLEAPGFEGPSLSADSLDYTLNLEWSGPDHIINNTRACADLYSRIPCSNDHEFPRPEELSGFDAYRRVSGSLTEVVVHMNFLTSTYERKVRRLEKEVEEHKAEAGKVSELTDENSSLKDKVTSLTGKVSSLTKSLGETNKIAEDQRLKRRELEGQLEQARSQQDSLQSFHDMEMRRLRASRELEVRQIVDASNEKLGRIKSSIADAEEVNKISGVMSQALAIRDYLVKMGKEEGITIPESRLEALNADFKRFETQLADLEVEEVGEEDFVVEEPSWMSAREPQPETHTRINEYGSHMTPVELALEVNETEAALDGQDQGPAILDAEAVDRVTGAELAPLNGVPVLPAPDASAPDVQRTE